ncbi:MAG: hypothetical protein LH609_21120 [Rudanella sp.]|nr:hypothetical protein [Rudanella sp.]
MPHPTTRQSFFFIIVLACQYPVLVARGQSADRDVVLNILKPHILTEARWAMQQQPMTVTAHTSPRSAGGPHDFFSEARLLVARFAEPAGAIHPTRWPDQPR